MEAINSFRSSLTPFWPSDAAPLGAERKGAAQQDPQRVPKDLGDSFMVIKTLTTRMQSDQQKLEKLIEDLQANYRTAQLTSRNNRPMRTYAVGTAFQANSVPVRARSDRTECMICHHYQVDKNGTARVYYLYCGCVLCPECEAKTRKQFKDASDDG